jgi:alpha-methylacyl-CoA racemase
LKGLKVDPSSLPGPREDRKTWPWLSKLFTEVFKTKTKAEWEEVFDDMDACCLPVRTYSELEQSAYDQRLPAVLKPPIEDKPDRTPESKEANFARTTRSPVNQVGRSPTLLAPGMGGEELLTAWTGWKRGVDYHADHGALMKADRQQNARKSSKL